MNYKTRAALIYGVAFLLFALSSCHCNSKPRAPQPPNVIIVLSDALRAASLPMYGYSRNTAPNLTELAKQSITFDSHLAHYPGTSVSISQLHTGRLMSPLLVTYKYIALPVRALPPDLLLMPREFGNAGYRTGLVTAHYWLTSEESWLVRFFQERHFVPPTKQGQSYAFFEELWPSILGFLDGAKKDDKPFFLYLHSFDTHGPNAYHPGFDEYRDAAGFPEAYNRYDSEIRYTDLWMGKLVDELRRRQLLDNTILVFTGDHGDDFNELGPQSWNSNHGPFTRRSLLHVPLIVRLPGGRSGGTRYQGLTCHTDLAPTLMHLALPQFDLATRRVDGQDLSGELMKGSNGSASERSSLSFTAHYWGITRRDVEMNYDLWSGEFSPLYRPVPDEHNYPRLETVDDPPLREQLMKELGAQQPARWKEFVDLPPTDELPNPALVGFMLPLVQVDNPSPLHGPILDDIADDNRWTFAPTYVAAAADEQPLDMTLSTPFVPGSYRVSILLHADGIRRGLKNDFGFEIGRGDNPPVHVAGSKANKEGWFDLGEQIVGKELTMTFRKPVGGIKVVALRMERPQRIPTVTAATPDEAVRERLRALGY